MGYLEGLLGGYMDRHHEIETQSRVDAHNAMVNQGNVYRQLLSSPDPKIKALAATGIIELGNPARKKGGLSGWMGEMESSPSYPRLMDYIRNLPETEQAAALAPTTPTGGAIPQTSTAPGGPGSAALPAKSATETGSPGLTPTQPSPAGNGVPQEPGPLGAVLPGTTMPVPQAPEAPAPSFAELTPDQIPNARAGFPGAPQPVPMPQPPPGLAAPGQPAPMPQPPPGMAAPGQPVPMPQPQPPAGPPITAPPPSMPPILAATKEGPGATPAAGGPPTTTAQMLASPPPRPPRQYTRASVFPSPADLKSESEEAEVTGLVSGWQEMFRLKGDPDWQENGLQAALAQKMRAGGQSAYQAIAGETVDAATGTARQTFGVFNRATGQMEEVLPDGRRAPLPNFRPRQTTGSTSLGSARNAAMLEFGYDMQDLRNDPAKMQQVNDRAMELTAQSGAETTAARAGAMAHADLSTADRENNMMKLRDDWRARSTKVMEQISAVSQMKVAYHAAKVRGDLAPAAEAMIVLFERSIDPTSVVREAEAARPGQFSGLGTRIAGALERLKSGGATIPLEELAKYVQLGDEMTQAVGLLVDDERARIERIATRMGIDPRDVVPPPLVNRPAVTPGAALGGPPPTPPAAATPGGSPAAAAGAPGPPPTAHPGEVTLDSKVMQGPNGKLVLVPR